MLGSASVKMSLLNFAFFYWVRHPCKKKRLKFHERCQY